MSCRRKIDSKLWLDYAHTMETEVRTLKQELLRTREALRTATKKCRDLVKELDDRTVGQESERVLRDQQLSRILRALLVLEARLKQEQKSIRQLLCEKDNVIRNQQLEIAKLRRYTKNYIKAKREQTFDAVQDSSLRKSALLRSENDRRQDSSLSKDIEKLKCEIITKLSPSSGRQRILGELDRGLKKTHSFAGSDISKTSFTSSENTDGSIITTTTDGSPSLLSTEGFCEGESTDASPGSTLNKSKRCTPTTLTDSENETTMIDNAHDNDSYRDDEDEEVDEDVEDENLDENRNDSEETTLPEDVDRFLKRGIHVSPRRRSCRGLKEAGASVARKLARTESQDDGLDCNFGSEDESRKEEPVYVNARNANNLNDGEHAENRVMAVEDRTNNNSGNVKEVTEEQKLEETSGNWYSDPDEDRINDDVFRHSAYRPSNNHNSVLECVNQILLRDMEEEENLVSVTRRFKHRGRIVRFQPAKLSDIESVGSEMERKNSEDGALEKEAANGGFGDEVVGNFEATGSEDEFGMKIVPEAERNAASRERGVQEGPEEAKAIPIVVIEPKFPTERAKVAALPSIAHGATPLKMEERVEEKTCLQMSAKGLTIAKNLDYEDIESLSGVESCPPARTSAKTPPALPPKPQFRNNTLILKKIPSPSFLIDETRRKQPLEQGRRIFGLSSPPRSSKAASCARSLSLEEGSVRENGEGENSWKSRFNNVRSSLQARRSAEPSVEESAAPPRVTNIVRQFEEFKIGAEGEEQPKERAKRHRLDLEQELDIRQNFEEFNLDDCDLSVDPDRAEADGSEKLANFVGAASRSESVDEDNLPGAKATHTGYDSFLDATGLSNKSILTPSRLLSNHKSMLKPKDVKYKNKIKATAVLEKHGVSSGNNNAQTHVRHWTGPFV